MAQVTIGQIYYEQKWVGYIKIFIVKLKLKRTDLIKENQYKKKFNMKMRKN